MFLTFLLESSCCVKIMKIVPLHNPELCGISQAWSKCTFRRFNRILLVFVTVGSSSSRTLQSNCGSLLITFSLLVDGQLSTFMKCSVHLSKIASFLRKVCVHFALKVCKDQELKQSEPNSSPQNQNGKQLK